MTAKFALIIPLIIQLCMNVVFADIAAHFGHGSSVTPIRSEQVQLESEDVQISVRGREYLIYASIVLKNHGPAQSVEIGIPYHYKNHASQPNWIKEPSFSAWLGKKDLDVTRKPGDHYGLKPDTKGITSFTYTTSFWLKKNEEKEINYSYLAGGSFYDDFDHRYHFQFGSRLFRYSLKTAALWKGPVKKININLHMRPCNVKQIAQHVYPKEHSAKRVGREIVLNWKYKNINPNFDIILEKKNHLLKELTNPDTLLKPLLKNLKENKKISITKQESRFYMNLLHAAFGYPFKNPLVYARFYGSFACDWPYNGHHSIMSPKKNFTDNMIPEEYKILRKAIAKIR